MPSKRRLSASRRMSATSHSCSGSRWRASAIISGEESTPVMCSPRSIRNRATGRVEHGARRRSGWNDRVWIEAFAKELGGSTVLDLGCGGASHKCLRIAVLSSLNE